MKSQNVANKTNKTNKIGKSFGLTDDEVCKILGIDTDGRALTQEGTPCIPPLPPLSDSPNKDTQDTQEAPSGSKELPVVILPNLGGDNLGIDLKDAARRVGQAFSNGVLYNHAGVVVGIQNKIAVDHTAPQFMSTMQSCVRTCGIKRDRKGEVVTYPTNPTKGQAEAILTASTFKEAIRPLQVISRSPVLVENPDACFEAHIVRNYDRASGTLVVGGNACDMEVPEAVELLNDLLGDFKFVAESDRSRAIAAILTPALIRTNMLGARAPISLFEADQSQTGKSHLVKLIATIYNEELATITQRSRGGVGGEEEAFCNSLMSGASMMNFDNFRGRFDSPLIESAMTEPTIEARSAYRRSRRCNMEQVSVLMTSNKAELTQDMANRCSPVRLLKNDKGHQWKVYPEDKPLLAHVKDNQGKYLGAVYAVIKKWVKDGKPRTNETRHDFSDWAQHLDWIIQNIFKLTPLCDDLEETRERLHTPQLQLVRDLAIAVSKSDMLREELKANQLVRLAKDGKIEWAGSEYNLDEGEGFKNANKAMGRTMGRVFKGKTAITVSGCCVERREQKNEHCNMEYVYHFYPSDSDRGIPPEQNAEPEADRLSELLTDKPTVFSAKEEPASSHEVWLRQQKVGKEEREAKDKPEQATWEKEELDKNEPLYELQREAVNVLKSILEN